MYTPELGINLDMLSHDVEFLKERYAQDVPGKSEGRLVIRYVAIIPAVVDRTILTHDDWE